MTSQNQPTLARGLYTGRAAFAIAIIVSAISLFNGFAFDDFSLIVDNDRVHHLASAWKLFGQSYWPAVHGGTLYRPLTMLAFTIEWAVGRGAPWPFHVANVLLYACVTAAVFALAKRLVPPWCAAIAAALFAAHPLHVEAVANAVGQSELIAALVTLVGVIWYLDLRTRTWEAARFIGILIAYVLGVLAKENAMVLPALLGAAELTVLRDENEHGESPRWRVALFTALIVVAIGLLALRPLIIGTVTGDLPNVVLSHLSTGQRVLTMTGVVLHWARLFVWPMTLTPVYSPTLVHVAKSFDAYVVFGLLIVLVFVVIALVTLRRHPSVAFGLLWVAIAIAPVSNLLVVTGIIVAERTLFLPSVGVVIAIGAAIDWLTERGHFRMPITVLASVAVVAGAARWIVRSTEWATNARLLTAAVRDTPTSYEAARLYGQYALDRGSVGTAERWITRAMELYPDDPELFVDLGELYRKNGVCEPAERAYVSALEADPTQVDARTGLVLCLLRDKRYDAARVQANAGIQNGREVQAFRDLLASIDTLVARGDSTRR